MIRSAQLLQRWQDLGSFFCQCIFIGKLLFNRISRSGISSVSSKVREVLAISVGLHTYIYQGSLFNDRMS